MNALCAPDRALTRSAEAFPDRCLNPEGFFENIQGRIDNYVNKWQATEGEQPNWGPMVSPTEKECHGREADRRIQEIFRLLLRCPKLPDRRGPWRQKLLKALRPAAECCCAVGGAEMSLLFTEPAMEATRQFIYEARGFEPEISEQDLFQALRNLWVIHSIQLLLDQPISFSPALFAYSMLYPWTDN